MQGGFLVTANWRPAAWLSSLRLLRDNMQYDVVIGLVVVVAVGVPVGRRAVQLYRTRDPLALDLYDGVLEVRAMAGSRPAWVDNLQPTAVGCAKRPPRLRAPQLRQQAFGEQRVSHHSDPWVLG